MLCQLLSVLSLFVYYNIKAGIWKRSKIFRNFILRNNHCSFTLTDKIVITSTTNILRKHQNEKYLFLFIYIQSIKNSKFHCYGNCKNMQRIVLHKELL